MSPQGRDWEGWKRPGSDSAGESRGNADNVLTADGVDDEVVVLGKM